MKNRVLILGGSGFIGENLIDYFNINSEYDLLNVDLVPNQESTKKCKYIKCDLRSEKLDVIIQKFSPNYIINLAAETSIKYKKISDYSTNIDGVVNLIKITNKYKLKKIIFFSTQYVYQNYPKWQNYKTYKPFTKYGESKVIGEKEVINKCKNPYLILRPTNIWGEGNMIYLNGLFKIMDRGIYFHPNKLYVLRSYGYVRNICYQTIKLMESESINKIYYISDRPIDLLKFVTFIQKEINFKPIKILPVWFFKINGFIGDILTKLKIPYPLNTIRVSNMIKSNPVPIEDTIKITGESPYTLFESIKNTIAWYKNYDKK